MSSSTTVIGYPVQQVLLAFERGVADIKPSAVKHIQNRSAGNLFPEDAVSAQISTMKFSQAKSAYENRKRKEASEYKAANKRVQTLHTQLLEKQQQKRQAAKKTMKFVLIGIGVVAALVGLFFLLKWLAFISDDTKKVQMVVIWTALILAIIGQIILKTCFDTGGWVSFFVLLILFAAILYGIIYGARALFVGDKSTPVIEQSYTGTGDDGSLSYTGTGSTDSLLAIRQAEVGDVVTYGTYNSDAIEWQVLDKQDGKILLLSAKCLFLRDYHDYTMSSPGWKDSSLREWLNEDFVSKAFTEEDLSTILWTDLENKANPQYGTSSGEDTSDLVFVLSYEEVMKYLPDAENRRALGPNSSISTSWWLRTMGESGGFAMIINSDGSINYEGQSIIIFSTDRPGCRPAIWLDISEE